MEIDLATAILAGTFGLVGVLGGILLTSVTSRHADNLRLKAEDERRWLTDRRTVYARFLGLAETMLRDIDRVAVFLSYDGTDPMSEEDEELVFDGLMDYFARWEDELQPALGEVQLLAAPSVADLADRVSGALLEVTAVVEAKGYFSDYYPGWFQSRDLLQVLRDAMRQELGVSAMQKSQFQRPDDWPWLPDRPPRASYVRQHAEKRRQEHGKHHPSSTKSTT